jgi:hypothetical protein
MFKQAMKKSMGFQSKPKVEKDPIIDQTSIKSSE